MKTRQEIKANAKEAMKQQWGTSIGAIVLLFAVSFVVGIIIGIFSLRAPMIGSLLSSAISIFVLLPLSVGLYGVFAKIYRKEQTSAGEIFQGFSVNYLRKVGGMLWMGLFVWLWTLLLIIPGIIKAFAYSMVPYILADCPNVTAREAMKLSMRMTKGYKGQLFVMGLSFIGWLLLGTLTLHILTIVFVGPYMYTTMAGYYNELKKRAIESGTISAAEFGEEVGAVVETEFAN